MIAAEYIFWASAGLFIYTYMGYPALMGAWKALFGKKVKKGSYLPSVTVVIAGYNEEASIGRKLRDILAQDYPADRLEVIFASDGSSDRTVEVARSFGARVNVLEFKQRRGKVSVLNDSVKIAAGEVLVFSDSRQTYDRGAIKALAACLNDPQVGAVSGELMLKSKTAGFGPSVASYWEYEKKVRRAESETGSVIGVTGAIWAMRRSLFEPYPPDTLLDDLYQPMRVVLKGYRVVFEPGARAFDEASSSRMHEIRRKVRTIAGNWQIFLRMEGVLNPFANRSFFQFVSHKLLRVLVPFFLAAALASNLALSGEPLYRATLYAQAAFYALCVLSVVLPASRAFRLFSAFTILNYSAVAGFIKYFSNSQEVLWKK